MIDNRFNVSIRFWVRVVKAPFLCNKFENSFQIFPLDSWFLRPILFHIFSSKEMHLQTKTLQTSNQTWKWYKIHSCLRLTNLLFTFHILVVQIFITERFKKYIFQKKKSSCIVFNGVSNISHHTHINLEKNYNKM